MKKLLFLLFSAFLSTLLIGQSHPIQVNVLIPNPTSPYLNDYIGLESQVVISLINTGNESKQIKLAGSFLREGDGYGLRTRLNFSPSQPIVLLPGQMLTLSPMELEAIYESGALQAVGGASLNDFIRNPVLTEGTYLLCVQAYDYSMPGYDETNILSNPIAPSCGLIMPLITSEPMYLQVQGQSCDMVDQIQLNDKPQTIVFTWSPSVPMTAGIDYEFTLLEFPQHVSDPNFLFNHPPAAAIEIQRVNIPQFILINAESKLIEGRRYAFRVKAVSEGKIVFRNNGISQACSFTYGTQNAQGAGISLSCHWPANGDTLPFRPLMFITDFAPYSDDYIQYNSGFQLRSGGTTVDERNRQLNWPRGPRREQSDIVGQQLTEDRSRYIVVSDPNQQRYSLERNLPYSWAGSVAVHLRGRTDRLSDQCQSDFVVGMGKPQPQSPENGLKVKPGNIIFNFRTSNQPMRLVPTYTDLVQAEGRQSMAFFATQVDEKWVLILSKDEDFRDIVFQQFGRIPDNGGREPGSESELAQVLYKSEIVEHTLEELGDYFWKIRWLNDPNSERIDDYYLESEIMRFTISNEEVDSSGGDDVSTDGEDCGSDCEAAEIPLAHRNPSNTSVVGDSIQVGKFKMKLTQIGYAGSKAYGKGEMKISFFKAPIKVKFTSIEINSRKEMYSGEITAEIDQTVTSLIPGLDRGLSALTSDSATSKFLHDFVNNSSRFVSQLSTDSPINLPIGWDQTIEDHQFTIGVIDMKFTPTQGTMNLSFSYDFPELNGWLSLGADDICFHDQGLANLSQIILYNPNDKIIGIPGSDSTFRMVIKGTSSGGDPEEVTHVSVDCDGFKQLRIVGHFDFPRTMLLPDSLNGETGSGMVKAHFNTIIRKQGDYMFGVQMDAFQLPSLPEVGFSAVSCWVDHSVEESPEGIRFPESYQALGGISGKSWKGFYMPELTVKLKIGELMDGYTGSEEARLSFGVNNLIIDDKVSLKASVRNILRLDQTDIHGWQISIDTFYLDILRSNFRSVGFNGRLRIPLDDTATLKYNAALTREPGGGVESRELGPVFFQFNVSVADSLRLNKLGISMHLSRNSFVELRSGGSRSGLTADFSGTFGITRSPSGGPPVDMMGILVENFRIKTWEREPSRIVSVRNISFNSPSKSINNFPIQIDSFKVDARMDPVNIGDDESISGPRIGLQFNVSVTLMQATNSFSAGTTVGIYARMVQEGGKTNFQFAGIHLECVRVRGGLGAVSLDGEVCIYSSHAVYGDGFRGSIAVYMKPGINVDATVQFGTINNSRYLFVDALVEFGEGQRIPLFPALSISGFGGGFYVNMRREGNTPYDMLNTGNSVRGTHSAEAGRSMSASRYVPEPGGGWGLKAAVFLKPQTGEAYRALVQFELEFSGEAFRRFSLNGELLVLSNTNNAQNAPIKATLSTEYNDDTKIFTLQADIFVNVLNVLKGNGGNNRAGYLDMYVNGTDGNWYIHIGKPLRDPEDRCALDVVGLFQFNAYIMTGKNLPGMPPPPPHIINVLQQAGIQYNPDRIGINPDIGDGFAIGAAFKATLDLPVPPLRFYLALTFGFDFSLRKTTARCRDTGESIGFSDGWYANGQIYAHLQGKISLYINLYFFSAEAVIFNSQMATVLRGGFPNPSWVTGVAAGSYELFGGKIKGRWSTEFEFGNVCPLENGSPFEAVQIIADISPSPGEVVDSDIIPSSAFNFEINGEFEFEQIVPGSDVPEIRRFKVLCDEFTLGTQTKPTRLVNCAKIIDAQKDPFVVKLIPDSYLPIGNYRAEVVASAQEYFPNRGWIPIRDASGKVIKEVKSTWFRILSVPDTLNIRDVQYTYPFRNQRYYLQAECRNGIIVVARNAQEIFSTTKGLTSNFKWDFRIELMNMNSGEIVEASGFRIHHSSGTAIMFHMPELLNETTYSIRLIKRKVNVSLQALKQDGLLDGIQQTASSQINRLNYLSSVALERSLSSNQSIGEHSQQIRRIDGKETNGNMDVLVYQYYFKTSKFNTASSKIAQLQSIKVSKQNEFGTASSSLFHELSGGESFDIFDVKPYIFTHHALPSAIFQPPFSFDIEWATPENPWLRDFAENRIYSAFRAISSTGCIGNRQIGNTVRHLRHPTLRHPSFAIEVVESYIKPPIDLPAQHAGNAPVSSFSNSYQFAGNSIQMAGSNSLGSPKTVFRYFPRTLSLVPLDLTDTKNAAAQMRAICTGEFLPRDMDILSRLVLNQVSIDYSTGTYPYRIYFNKHVFLSCPGADYSILPVRTMFLSYRQ
jgi:hypothetical protein